MRDNHEIRFPINLEFKKEILIKIKQYAPDLKITSSFKKIFLIGWFSWLDNLQKNKNLLEIPLKPYIEKGITSKNVIQTTKKH